MAEALLAVLLLGLLVSERLCFTTAKGKGYTDGVAVLYHGTDRIRYKRMCSVLANLATHAIT